MDEPKLIDGQFMSLEEVYEKFRPLIASLSHKLLKTAYKFGLEFDDLFGFGSEGLIKAFRKFESDKGFKFMTYAFPLVKGEIQRRIRDFGSVVKFSRTDKALAAEIHKKELQGLSIVEICESTGKKQREVLSALAILNGPAVSMDKQINDISDQIGVESDFSTIVVQDFLSTLNTQMRKVVVLAMNDKTQSEIAKEIGTSQVQVSRILKKVGTLYEEYLAEPEGEEEMSKLEITVEEFVDLRYVNKLPITKIAELKGVSDPAIHHWMKKHKAEIVALKCKKQPTTPFEMETLPEINSVENKSVTAQIKAPEPKTIQEAIKEAKAEESAEYERLIAALRKDLTDINYQLDEKDELIRNLRATIEKYDHVNAGCEDVENELASLQVENGRLESELHQLHDENHFLDLENQAMRQLLKLWI